MTSRCMERKNMRSHVRLRQLLLVVAFVSVFLWGVSTIYLYFFDSCHGHQHTAFLCHQFNRGIISGNLCDKLCTREEISLSYCLRKQNKHSVFLWRHWEIFVNDAHLVPDGLSVKSPAFEKPPKGTSMEQFHVMVSAFVDEKLGSGDHSTLVEHIMNFADINNDSKISLAEAKSIWALIQSNEFFIRLIFKDSEHLPELHGFCGDSYALEHHFQRYLYHKEFAGSSLVKWFFPKFHSWFFPSWIHRAKVMLGFLEFTLEAYQHGTDGTFHMCDISEQTIGHTFRYDVMMSDLSEIVSDRELVAILSGQSCRMDTDCAYSPQCTTICDTKLSRCSGNVTQPNLYHVCKILGSYILPGAPVKVLSELNLLLARCAQLGMANSTRTQVEHSLVLNELKSLLWNEISNSQV